MSDAPQAIRLADYQPPDYEVQATHLHFEIGEGETRVENRMKLRRASGPRPLLLDGENMTLESVSVDGRPLAGNEYLLEETRLTIHDLPEACEVTVVTRIEPEKNTALEGLYKSSSMYCTQCEAEGFRRITYYPDRPDVLSVFTTSIVTAAGYPILLANGNKISDEVLADGRRQVTWHDPHPKPSYLFALVAGDLSFIEDEFVTASGRRVTLQIFTEPHNIEQCDYAMAALKRSMRWDEEVYGREYDLDIYMIVAVDDFNMGAMENKGLNIFNTSCVLATKDTATDQAHQRVEAVIAHEYFHNWSGNRVTCRDWFQLSLKEGFTVFRDAQFSGDMNSRTVKRIEDVNLLRSVQFAEDAGPLAHPVRPASYIEISNFYTPTVYEKGAEVVGMVQTLIGAEAFRAGSDLYFERHDGQAVTTEDFLAAMADSSGVDLGQFQRWYDQAGTPLLEVSATFEGDCLSLTFEQSCPATPGQAQKQPFHVPVAFGLLGRDGQSLVSENLRWTADQDLERRGDSLLLHLKNERGSVEIRGLDSQPEISMLRGFSAPVKVTFDRPSDSLAFLATRDPDGFAAWDALQTLLVQEIDRLVAGAEVSAQVTDLFGELLSNSTRTAEQRFLLAAKLAVPSENYLFEAVDRIDVDGLCSARDRLLDVLASVHEQGWRDLYAAHQLTAAYSPDAEAMAHRALKNTALGYLSHVMPTAELEGLLADAFAQADNLTDRRAVLLAAVNGLPERPLTSKLLADFYERWQSEALVVNQWFAVQSAARHCDLKTLKTLVAHPAFEMTNPNKVRSVLSVFAGTNQRNFHAIDGSGYAYVAEQIVALNGINPQMAAALAKPLTRWRRYAGERSNLMRNALMDIAGRDGLSTDVFEVVTKSLA